MTINRSVLFTIVGLLFAALFTPLIVTTSLFFPFITGKNFTFRIIIELAAVLWVFLMLRDAKYRPKFSWLTISVALFVLIVGVADIFSSNPVKSFLSNFERMEGWITLAHLAVYFLMTITLFKKWSFWERFFQTSVAVSAIVCVYSFLQLAGTISIHQSVSRLDATFGNAAYLAIYMLFHVFITAILLSRWLKRRYFGLPWYQDPLAYIYGVMIILQASILFLTATRGSILGLIGGVIVTTILVAITERQNLLLRKVTIGILAALVLLIGIFLVAKNSNFVQKNEVLSRIASISLSDGTTKSRFMIWNMAWQGVTSDVKHFTIGWGQESFNYVFAKYYNPGMYGQEQWFDRSHDVVFDWLTAAGVLGLAAYLGMFVMTLYVLWRKSAFSNVEKSLITGLFLGYFFHNIFVFDNITSYIMFFSIMAFVGSSAYWNIEEPKKETKEASELLQYCVVTLAVVVIGFVFYQYGYKAIAANQSLIRAITQTQVPATNSSQSEVVYTEENVKAFKNAIAYNTIGLYETREQLLDAAQKAIGTNSQDGVKKEMLALAKSEIDRQLKETPNDIRYYVLSGNFYQEIGDYGTALQLLLKAETFSPKKQSLLFAVGSNYFSLKQYTQALSIFKQAYEEDATNDEAKTLYGVVAVYLGQDKLVQNLFGTTSPIMDPRFLQAYRATKHYDLMIKYLEQSAVQHSTDIQSQIALADGYVVVGSINKAVAVMQKIKTLVNDPNALSQIDGIIKDIKAGKNPFETVQ